MNKKVIVFLPDGGGLRNFVYSKFYQLGVTKGYDVTFWNNSNYPINERFKYKEKKLEKIIVNPLTPIYSRARKRIELNISKAKFKDNIYDSYKFPLNFKGIKNSLKSLFILFLIKWYASEKGLKKLKDKIDNFERKTNSYKILKAELKKEKPDLVFCSNQRNTQSLSLLIAARDLGIKTICFVQSWDNVPKAMQVVNTGYYFVWSDLMKTELLQYYPSIKEKNIFVTGTPQFEPHFNEVLVDSRESFLEEYNLDFDKKYICYSGDDETTSPLDQYYLEDLAIAVRKLNSKGYNLAVIFRRCPVDFSNRFNTILNKYKDVINEINPIWNEYGTTDKQRLPEIEDSKLLNNVCRHSELVTNVCSSTVFDFVTHNKPCIYYDYEQPQLKKGIRDIGQNYHYVHFRSMPENAVVFCKDKNQLESKIESIFENKVSTIENCLNWFKVVAGNTPKDSCTHFWNAIDKIIIN